MIEQTESKAITERIIALSCQRYAITYLEKNKSKQDADDKPPAQEDIDYAGGDVEVPDMA